jgi:hypothetical protein
MVVFVKCSSFLTLKAVMVSHLEKVMPKLAALGNLSPYIFLFLHNRYCHTVHASVHLVAHWGLADHH